MSNKYTNLKDMDLVLLFRKNNDKLAVMILCQRLEKECVFLARQLEKTNKNSLYSYDELYVLAKENVIICAKSITLESDAFIPYWKKAAKCNIITTIKKTNKSSCFCDDTISLDCPISDENKSMEFQEVIGEEDDLETKSLVKAIFDYLNESKNFTKLDKQIFKMYLDGYANKEISILCHCSLSNVYKSINETSEKLRIAILNNHFKK